MLNDLEKLNQLSCEIIELFNRFGIDDYYGIMLPDKYYNSLHGWQTRKNPYNYKCSNEEIWNDNFNMILESEVHTMFHDDPDSIHEMLDLDEDKTDSKRLIRCYALLRRLFRRYNLEWNFINQGCGLTFREIG